MKLYIDCEFNSYKGKLITMALVPAAPLTRPFYCGPEMPDKLDPWVAQHVMPVLGAAVILPKAEFQKRLEKYLMQFDSIEVIADWPEDLQHFCEQLIVGPGERINTPPLTMRIERVDAPSEVPHNALADAIGIRDMVEGLR